MKTALTLIGFICFSFSFKEKGAVNGTWQGAYGLDDQIKNTWVVFGPSNSLEFYEGEMKTENKVTGSYSLLGDTAISFTCKKNNGFEIQRIYNAMKIVSQVFNFGATKTTPDHVVRSHIFFYCIPQTYTGTSCK